MAVTISEEKVKKYKNNFGLLLKEHILIFGSAVAEI